MNPVLRWCCCAVLVPFAFLPALLRPVAAAHAAPADAAAPVRCLAEVGRAIDNGDVAAFERQVDVDGILEQALALVARDMERPGSAERYPPLLALVFSQAAARNGGGEAVRGLLKSEARAFILNGVASGAFAGRAPSGGGSGLLAPLFADASLGRKEIRRVGAATPDGEGWRLPFVVHDAGNGQEYAVLGRFSPTENGCRLTSVENLEELFDRIRRESMAN